MRRLLPRLLLLLLALLLLAALVPLRVVADDEMSPGLQRGDLIWVLPVAPLRGDVVVLDDPLDPGRTILRRTLTGPETKVSWDDGGVRVAGKRVRQSDMGVLEEDRLIEELIWSKPPAREKTWRVRLRKQPAPWLAEELVVPEGHWYLLADDRDRALDSRSFGTVPEAALQGVVRLRLGPPDPWRPWFERLIGWE
jgi:signal peptidase I